MVYKFLFTLLLIVSFFLNSCGSNSQSNKNSKIFSLEEKKFLHTLFLTEYLWFDQVASTIDYSHFNTPQKMINQVRLNPPDRWSFMLTQQQYEDFANQKTVGFGFGFTSDFQIFLVRIDSPAYGKLQRGDKIIQVDGEEVNSSLISESSKNIHKPTTFSVLRSNNVIDVTITPREYSFKVSLGKIITRGSKKVGYLRYDAFTESSVAEFESIFTTFHNKDIDELVIDLRYNGGGSLAATSSLIDNIVSNHAGERQMYLDWNSQNKSRNSAYTFEDADLQDGNELMMKRVVFLVTKHSASASEALINALKPYLGSENVIKIGEETHGKPVGMSGRTYGQHYYFLINFFVKNNADETTSFDGIPVTCTAEDDITHMMGDKNETMFSTALYYIENNTCP